LISEEVGSKFLAPLNTSSFRKSPLFFPPAVVPSMMVFTRQRFNPLPDELSAPIRTPLVPAFDPQFDSPYAFHYEILDTFARPSPIAGRTIPPQVAELRAPQPHILANPFMKPKSGTRPRFNTRNHISFLDCRFFYPPCPPPLWTSTSNQKTDFIRYHPNRNPLHSCCFFSLHLPFFFTACLKAGGGVGFLSFQEMCHLLP